MSVRKISAEIVIIGAGPAGIAAAAASFAAGKRAIVIDDNPAVGGQIWRGYSLIRMLKEGKITGIVGKNPQWMPEMFPGISISDCSEPGILFGEAEYGTVRISYGKLILATGARERFLPFPGWTLPNVTGVGGLQALVKSGYSIAGKRVVIAGTGPLLPAVAVALKASGARVAAIIEQATASRINGFARQLLRWPTKFVQAIGLHRALAGIPYWKSSWVVEAHGVRRVESVRIRRNGVLQEMDCDHLACAYNLVPNLELPELLGCSLDDHGVVVSEIQESTLGGVFAAGEVTGIGGMDLSVTEGLIAGYAASGVREISESLFKRRERQRMFARELERTFQLREELRQLPGENTFVCRCEDVPYSSVRAQTSWRAAKLQTRCGMGLCQGRICGSSAAFLFGWGRPGVRPPLVPVRADSFCGSERE